VDALRFSQDSKKLAVKSRRGLEVWQVATQSLNVRVEEKGGIGTISLPVFWTTKDTIVTAFGLRYHDFPRTIYEFDASTLEIVRAPFGGHLNPIISLALSIDCALLVGADSANTIKLWAFESRQLLASFHVLYTVYHLILSPDSRQLVYTTLDLYNNNNIYLCNTPHEILASIQPVLHGRISAPRNPPPAESGALSFTAN
jgi:WD40 repeat protein